jgi:hypothetical protein
MLKIRMQFTFYNNRPINTSVHVLNSKFIILWQSSNVKNSSFNINGEILYIETSADMYCSNNERLNDTR